MKKYFVFYILTISLMFCLTSIVYAFYVVTQETSDIIFTTGNLEYEITEESCNEMFIDKTNSFIVPGEELVQSGKTIYMINKSTISSQVRIVIRVKVADQTYYVDATNTNEIIAAVSDGWVFNETDICWYYEGEDGIVPAVTVANPTLNINILSSLKLNGNYFGNAVSSKEVTVTIVYQSKQAEYAKWDNIEEININLGN